MQRFWMVVFLLVSFTLGCQSSGETDQVEQAEKKPKPLYVSYEKFDDIAPLFNKNNDTTYVINFWATWCKPCVEELPYFEDLYAAYSDKKVKIILVSLDFPNQIESKFIPFLEERQLGPDIALLLDGDANTWIDRVNPEWGGAIPVTLVYKNEVSTFHSTQFASFDELEEIVKEIL